VTKETFLKWFYSHYYKMPMWGGGCLTLATGILWHVSTVAPRCVTEPLVAAVVLNSNGLAWHIFTRCYCDHLVAATSHYGRHTSPLLLRATIAMTIRVISPGPIATMGHCSDLQINSTSLIQSGTDPHKYLLRTLQIEVVPTDNLEILDYPWTTSSPFKHTSPFKHMVVFEDRK
jgi:hypothetical protein